jgi:hypothetical protein
MSHQLIGLAVAILLFEPPPVTAQETDLSSILVHLIQNEIFLAGPPPGSPFPSHSAHFAPGEERGIC